MCMFQGELVLGIVVVEDTDASAPAAYIDLGAAGEVAPEPAPPKPFTFNPDLDE